jgi:CheY-like chemotaxis protein
MAHKLLLADDSVTIQRVIELTFADEDVQVIAVGDGKQAIEYLQRERPDIVLADVGMPERDGYEVASYIKGQRELAHIPVLLLTGAFEPIDEARARAVGCDGVLVKPFEPQMVISRVKDLLSGRLPATPFSHAPPVQAPRRQPEQPVQPSPEVELKSSALAEAPPAPSGSLEDYFDRLDAAFATLDGGHAEPVGPPAPPPARPHADFPSADSASRPAIDDLPGRAQAPSPTFAGLGDDLAGWDPDIAGDPARPAAIEPPPIHLDPLTYPPARPQPAPPPVSVAPAAPAPAPPVVTPARPAVAAQSAAPAPTLVEAFAALLAAEQGQHFAPPVGAPQAVSDQVIEDIVQRVIARMTDGMVRDTVLDVAERLVREEIARIKSA